MFSLPYPTWYREAENLPNFMTLRAIKVDSPPHEFVQS